jgi:hypothetical protein
LSGYRKTLIQRRRRDTRRSANCGTFMRPSHALGSDAKPEAEPKNWPSSTGDDTPGERSGPVPGEAMKPTRVERWALFRKRIREGLNGAQVHYLVRAVL